MKRAVVIGTWPGGAEPLRLLLDSLKGCGHRIVVVVNSAETASVEWIETILEGEVHEVFVNAAVGFELAAFRTVLDQTDVDEFLFLQDTFEVKDQSFIDVVFGCPDSVALGPTFFHYAGKWKRSVLEQMDIPVVRTKHESIHWEHTFSRLYWEREPVWVFDPHFHDGEHHGFVERFGRLNMLLENEFYLKRKGTWG
jgi:hypothetical protein